MEILVIIPAKDEQEKIVEVVREIIQVGWPVLVVDDGSIDDTASRAKAAGAAVVRHPLNRGQGAALKTGIDYALANDFDQVVFFDADGQMMATEIAKVVLPLAEGYEVVLGSRFLGQAKAIPWLKLLTLKMALGFTRLNTGLKLSDTHNGFQAWQVSVLKKINLTQDRQAYASQLLQEISRHKLKYKEVPVTIVYTDYSKRKGQSVFNAFNILWDLIIKR